MKTSTFIFCALPVIVAAMLCFPPVTQAGPKRPVRTLSRSGLACAPFQGVKAATGEIVLSGTIRSVDAFTRQITMSADRFSLPDGKSRAIVPAKPKLVLADADTFIHYSAGNRAHLDVRALVVGSSLEVVGEDGGTGHALRAREVVVGLPAFVTEIETLKTRDMDGGGTQSQDMTQWSEAGEWSNDAQLFWRDAAVGDVLTLEFSSPASGNYAFELSGTKAFDYGIVRVSINGVKNPTGPLDLYNRDVVPVALDKGIVPLVAGTNVLRVEIVGRNPQAYNQFVGLDAIVWKPAPSS